MNRDDWRSLAVMIAIALLICCTGAAWAGEQRIDCATVRAKFAEYGKLTALAWAVAHGYTATQIREARKCLK